MDEIILKPLQDNEFIDLPELLREIQNWYIAQALAKRRTTGGAAKLLGLKRTTLRAKLDRDRIIDDPEGDFTVTKDSSAGAYNVFYKDELMATLPNIIKVNTFLREKLG